MANQAIAQGVYDMATCMRRNLFDFAIHRGESWGRKERANVIAGKQRPITGLFALLSSEKKKEALSYDGLVASGESSGPRIIKG